jgi:hypothetical protein
MFQIAQSAHFQYKSDKTTKNYSLAIVKIYGVHLVVAIFGYAGGTPDNIVHREMSPRLSAARKRFNEIRASRLQRGYLPTEGDDSIFDPNAAGGRLNTVNVIECIDGIPKSVRSFPDNKEGNRKAEELFTAAARENGLKGDASNHLEDGTYENGTYSIFLTHSS